MEIDAYASSTFAPKAHSRSVSLAPGKELDIETGRLAKQANGSVVVRQGGTMVLCTATASDGVREGQSFFPLTVDYQEKFAAGGKIPGGFIKREGRPSDDETLTARLVDRALRPLFPDGFYNSVHVVCTVISADTENNADVLAGTGASAALMLSGLPFGGPIAEVRVGRVDGQFVINPTIEQRAASDLDLIVAGKEDAIVMVEGEAHEISEEDMIDALDEAHEVIRELCRAQHALVQDAGGPAAFEYETFETPAPLVERVRQMVGGRLEEHIRSPYDKTSFYGGIGTIKDEAIDQLLGSGDQRRDTTDDGYTASQIKDAVGVVQRDVLRDLILSEGYRLDGRGPGDVRPIWSEVGYLPRVHGSAVFTRGETQVLGSVTLGTGKDVQPVDQVFTTDDKPFFLHYRFPPYSVGEASFMRGPKRREIGHGMLAERALSAVIPEQEDFPYTIRINAEVLESNGSSSMASVCAGSLALMDAGVPIRKPVAGVAMGLVTDGSRTQILTDILGTEDHLGDMDFKLTGTRDGITACQMDIKVDGLQRETLLQALRQAREARLHILGKMDETLSDSRDDLSPHAPRLTQVNVDGEHVGAIIGPGGKVVRSIQSETNTEVTIEEVDGVGVVTIAARNQQDADAAIERIKQIVAVPEEGAIYDGTVRTIKDFGALIEIMPGKVGLLHISELDHGYVEDVRDYVKVGDKIKVQLTEIRGDGKFRLSRKPFLDSQDSNGRS